MDIVASLQLSIMRNSVNCMTTPSQFISPKPISTATAEHYTWGSGCDAWFLLKTGSLHVIQEKMSAHSAEIMHYHAKSRQLFYVLKGELTMLRDNESLTIPARHALAIEPGSAHRARNDSGEPVEFLVISSPPSHGDRFNCE